MSPEDRYRRLRDPERWIGIEAPSSPAAGRVSTIARRSRGVLAVQVLVAVVVVAVAAAVVVATQSAAHRTPPADPDGTSIGAILRSVTLPGDTRSGRLVTAASDAALYVADPTTTAADDANWYLSRIDATTGAVTTVKLYEPELYALAVGPAGLYVSTSTDPAHWDASSGTLPRDAISRLDLTSLKTLDAVMLPTGSVGPSDVAFAAGGGVLAEADGGGSVRLFEPYSFDQQKAVQVLSRAQVEAGGTVQRPVLENPTSDGGRVWVVADGHLVALDDALLHTDVSVPQQGYDLIVPTSDGLRVLGDHVGALADDGTITPDVSQGIVDADHPVVAAVATDGGVLEQVDGAGSRTVLLQRGDAPATNRLYLTPSGALLGGAGPHGWVTGVPGTGSAISEVALAVPVAASASASAQIADGRAVATVVTAQNVRSFKVGVDIAAVPQGDHPAASSAQAFAACGAGAVCGTRLPEHFLLALVSTREGLSDRLAYVMQWTGEYCLPDRGPAAPGETQAPVHPQRCNLVAVIDASTGTPLFSQSGPG